MEGQEGRNGWIAVGGGGGSDGHKSIKSDDSKASQFRIDLLTNSGRSAGRSGDVPKGRSSEVLGRRAK